MITPGARWSARVPKDIVTATWVELVAGPPGPVNHGWQRDAECANDDRFYYDVDTERETEQLRKVCSDCPVIASCLRDALGSEDSSYVEAVGVRGGLNARERNRIRRLRSKARGARPPVLVPPSQATHAPMTRDEFIAAVADLAATHATYDEALDACGYTGRDGQFYRRLWRAQRLDLYQQLRDPNPDQGAA